MKARVVFDANVFLQAALSERGPAFSCLAQVQDGMFDLILTRSILDEVEEVLERLSKVPRYSNLLTDERIRAYIELLGNHAVLVPEPPETISLPRDPDDEVYLNAALEYDADFLITRDKDLLEFELEEALSGRLRIVDPTTFLAKIS